jgi:hypothetical protein
VTLPGAGLAGQGHQQSLEGRRIGGAGDQAAVIAAADQIGAVDGALDRQMPRAIEGDRLGSRQRLLMTLTGEARAGERHPSGVM